MPADDNSSRDIFSVSRLNSEVRHVLEGSFPLLWVEGEVSNLAQPRSGHLYLSLKDSHAQVRCAMFRNRRTLLRFQPKDGDQVLVRARISFYEPRGDFQLVIEHMEPAGEGALQRAFEELKAKLQAEGLFDAARKRELPAFPRRIGIVTSPSGAAVRDVLHVLKRRYPALPVMIYPVPVQGAGAAAEIVAALKLAEQRADCDVLILTRGGGSLEDLAEFNDETLARTIAALKIPLISAVGHEIDFTIADFVADRRAPTPSAAAELASPEQSALTARVKELKTRLLRSGLRHIRQQRPQLRGLTARLQALHPANRLRQYQQRLDELELRARRAVVGSFTRQQQRLNSLATRLRLASPAIRVAHARDRLGEYRRRLGSAWQNSQQRRRQQLAASAQQLHMISPLQTLARGYAIARLPETGEVLRHAGQLQPGQAMETLLGRGRVLSRVETIDDRELDQD